jgi:glycosyltransferase involved in cell wall biosynthesis
MEIVIADGFSTDGTRSEIEAWKFDYPDVEIRVVDNPKRVIPAALNNALKAADGDIIIRLDAHSIPEQDYVSRSVQALRQGLGDNIGGQWQIKPGASGWIAESIAFAAAHPLGVGGAQYRIGGVPQIVDTVPFSAFYRNLVKRIGFYDEELLSNEDYEYNARIRQAGGVVWFDPEIRSNYLARSTFGDLSRQYWRYGYWKFQMLRKYPQTIRWRQALPPLFILSIFVLGFSSIWFNWALWILFIETFLYFSALLFVAMQALKRSGNIKLVFGVPFAIMMMHFSWGIAFLWSFSKTMTRSVKT